MGGAIRSNEKTLGPPQYFISMSFARVLALATLLCACRQDAPSVEDPKPYPSGGYWLDPELPQTLVAGELLAVSFAGAVPHPASAWLGLQVGQRTREGALAAAREARAIWLRDLEQGVQRPRPSDALSLSASGGDFGTVRAVRFPPPILDAFAHLALGEVSRVLESDGAFFVLRRRPVAAPERLSGRRLRYAASELEKAKATLVELRSGRLRFDDALAQLTPGLEAGRGGDMGSWSSWEDHGEPGVLATLARLKVGEFSEPVFTRAGVQVLLRTAEVDRERLGADAILVPGSREEARQVLRALQAGASVEETLESCTPAGCLSVGGDWTLGRAGVELEAVVTALAVGQTAAQPASSPSGWLAIRRRPPAPSEPPPPPRRRTSFPQVEGWGLETAIRRLQGPRLGLFVAKLGHHLEAHLELSQEEQLVLRTTFKSLRGQLPLVPPKERLRLVSTAEQELHALLGHERFASLERLRAQWFEAMTRRSGL